jgi:hypothetical protein
MNRTQKGAWFNLVTFVLFLAVAAYVVIERVVVARKSWLLGSPWIWLIPLLMGITLFILHRKKQSKLEVRLDERDKLIKKRALVIAYFTVWTLLIAAFIISWVFVGREGSIPISALGLILYFVFIISSLVYFATTLVQYSWGGGDAKT